VALLTERVEELTRHLNQHKKDFSRNVDYDESSACADAS